MSKSIDLLYKKVDFVSRYEKICKSHNDFQNSLSGNNPEVYSAILLDLGYKAKYYKSESFYRIEEKEKEILFGLQLVLKDGMVEIMFYGEINKEYFEPAGRLDFLCEKLDSSFDRKTFNLPKYSSEEELKLILKDIFLLYEDLKKEIVNSLNV